MARILVCLDCHEQFQDLEAAFQHDCDNLQLEKPYFYFRGGQFR